MKINLDHIFKIVVLIILSFMCFQIYLLKREMNDNLHEIDMVISKLDYVESDINTPK